MSPWNVHHGRVNSLSVWLSFLVLVRILDFVWFEAKSVDGCETELIRCERLRAMSRVRTERCTGPGMDWCAPASEVGKLNPLPSSRQYTSSRTSIRSNSALYRLECYNLITNRLHFSYLQYLKLSFKVIIPDQKTKHRYPVQHYLL